MSDKKFDLSRRKVLGSIGAVGAAGALGGAATNALLWDEETFGDGESPNVLQAGQLDLKVDWEEHYYDGTGEATAYAHWEGDEFVIDDPEAFMRATLVSESDGLVDDPEPVVTIEDVKPGDRGEVTFSYHLFDNPGWVTMCADVLADGDNGIVEPEDAVAGGDGDSDGDPLVGGGGDGEQDGQVTSGDDPDVIDAGEYVEDGDGELGNLARAKLWYDPNCDNMLSEEPVEVMMAFDLSDSMISSFPGATDDVYGEERSSGTNGNQIEAMVQGSVEEFLDPLKSTCGSTRVGAVAHGDDLAHSSDEASLDVPLTDDYGETEDPIEDWLGDDANTTTDTSDDYVIDSGNQLDAGMETARQALLNPGDGGIESSAADVGDARKIIVFLTDGEFKNSDERDGIQASADDANADGIEVYPVQINTTNFNDSFWASISEDDNPRRATDYSELSSILGDLVTEICTGRGTVEQVIAEGTLNQVMRAIGGFDGECNLLNPAASSRAGLGAVADEFEGTDCHEPDNHHCVALEWWLPRDIPGFNDNIVQTDRYEFTVGFNAVQCRHNVDDEGEPIAALPSEADDVKEEGS